MAKITIAVTYRDGSVKKFPTAVTVDYEVGDPWLRLYADEAKTALCAIVHSDMVQAVELVPEPV